MKSFDTQAYYKELVATGLSEQQASTIVETTSTIIQASTENAIEQIKRQYRLDDGVTNHDLKLLELKQDSNFNQFLHEFKMQELQAATEEAKRKTKYWQNWLIAFYVFETLAIAILIIKV